MSLLLNNLSVFPSSDALTVWQNELSIKKGLFFELPIIKLSVINTIESWTYLDLEQSFNMFKDLKGDWLVHLTDQVLDELFSECLNIKFN